MPQGRRAGPRGERGPERVPALHQGAHHAPAGQDPGEFDAVPERDVPEPVERREPEAGRPQPLPPGQAQGGAGRLQAGAGDVGGHAAVELRRRPRGRGRRQRLGALAQLGPLPRVPEAVRQGHRGLHAGQRHRAPRRDLHAARQGLPADGQPQGGAPGLPGRARLQPREPRAFVHHRADLPAPQRAPARLRLPGKLVDPRPEEPEGDLSGRVHHPGQQGHGRRAPQVPRRRGADAPQRPALEQHRHGPLRQGQERRRRVLPQARALLRPLRVDHLLQSGARAPAHGAVRVGLPPLQHVHQPHFESKSCP